jgi:hypothetical protein
VWDSLTSKETLENLPPPNWMKGPHVVVVVSQRDGRRERDIRFIIARTRKGDVGISERAYLYRLGESIVKWRRERETPLGWQNSLLCLTLHTSNIQIYPKGFL